MSTVIMNHYLTREQAVLEHRKMWYWIADETLKQKRCIKKIQYLHYRFEFYRWGLLDNNCFLCEYTGGECDKCPLAWNTEHNFCDTPFCDIDDTSSIGLFAQWKIAVGEDDYKKAANLARQIADLLER